jgi:fructan beta-fructosidase
MPGKRIAPTSILLLLVVAGSLLASDLLIAERDIKVTGKYLLLPISKNPGPCAFRGEAKAMQQQLDVRVDGTLVHSPSLGLAHRPGDIAFWGQLDMSQYVGKTAHLRMRVLNENAKQAVPADSQALAMIDTGDQPRGEEPLYGEALRPQLRFSQMRGWNNDTNGMLYYDGEYHLFWQANPVGLDHANMYWGHAVSSDLVHWNELPEALRPYAQGETNVHRAMAVGRCHSGGGAVDFNNTGGWQVGENKTLLLTFTDTGMKSGRQRDLPGFTESIAYSVDKGRSWTIWEDNPIIRHIGRDPKLFWYEQGKHWSIAVYDEDAVLNKARSNRGIAFYKSNDLKNWERTGRLEGFFECPEIFEAPVIGTDGKTRWVMFGGDGQYVVGDFTGEMIVPEHAGKHRFIYGNVYAGQCFSNAPDGRVIYMGWARGLKLPNMPFNQAFTVPLEVTLHETPDGVRMRGYPVKELDSLRGDELLSLTSRQLVAGERVVFETNQQLADIELTVTPAPGAEQVRLSFGDVTIGYDFKKGKALGLPGNNGRLREFAPVQLEGGKLHLRLIVDRPMCEVFYNTGEAYALIPRKGGKIGKLTLQTEGVVDEFRVFGMQSIWE